MGICLKGSKMYVINFIFHSDDDIRAIVFSKSEEFFKYLNVEELIPHLKTRKLLTKAEEAILNSSTDRCLANKKLMRYYHQSLQMLSCSSFKL